jgi:hypothetical protein
MSANEPQTLRDEYYQANQLPISLKLMDPRCKPIYARA